MSFSKLCSLLFVLSAFAGLSRAYWRMGCGNIQTGRIDPVATPGKLAGHSHKIVGPSSTLKPSSPATTACESHLTSIVISLCFTHLQPEEANANHMISLDIGLNSTYDDIIKAQCTSCTVQADKSAYWAPNLYYAHSDGTFEEVSTGAMLVNFFADSVLRCLPTA